MKFHNLYYIYIYIFFFIYVFLTVHFSMTLVNDQLDVQIFNTFITILYMYMFRAISCSSSGQIVLTLNLLTCRIWWAPNNASRWQMGFNLAFKVLIQHLVSSLLVSDRPVHRLRKNCSSFSPDGHLLTVMVPDAVLIQFDLLRMSKILLETCTCRGM